MNKNIKDRTGQVFGFLTAIRLSNNGSKLVHWDCKCSCGNEVSVSINSLVTGNTKSCGCYRSEKLKTARIHGHCLNGVSKEYKSYTNMINRCYNVKNKQYKDYGQRGVIVCESWRSSFKCFIEDMGNKPTPQHSLDRIDNDGNYEPSNCRWATDIEQRRNKRNNVWIEYNGVKKIMSDWAYYLGTNYVNLRKHIKRGKTFEEAYEFYKNK